MITEEKGTFFLETRHTSYWFAITEHGHPEHIYYGPRLRKQPAEGLKYKRTAAVGSSVCYSGRDPLYCLDNLPLEYSSMGRGDYRFSPLELKMPDGSNTADFKFHSFEITRGTVSMETLPCAYADEEKAQTLCVILKDAAFEVYLKLFYTVFYDTDVITRRAVLINEEKEPVVIRRFLSMMLDLPDRGFSMRTFNGGWAKEAHMDVRRLNESICLNSSVTGASGNRHNPGFLLEEEGAGEEDGLVYGFNLIYSGNHMGAAELSAFGLARVAVGINDQCFSWKLLRDESFATPEAVLTVSQKGRNGVSGRFHDFINRHVVRGEWKGKVRPVLLNSWEACFFDFTENRLLKMAREAKALGIELFVLDDGWFGQRDNDKAGLGDYTVNTKKLPSGVKGLAEKIHGMGMKFGLWFEPEMVNEDSRLFRTHPDWAVKNPNRPAVVGRNQLVLDLTRQEVQDYIVSQVSAVLDDAKVDYVKWDMNRHIAEAWSDGLSDQGEFYHRYICGLYAVLGRIFNPRPHILVESCSSGGNRFDLGMLAFSQQIWASDDTDPVERLKIQEGLSCLYPLSAIGAHVSSAPHQQTLRDTPLSTRFHVAAFGCLGYELDLKYLTPAQKKEIRQQIIFYKKHRRLFQYGRFKRIPYPKENKVIWQAADKSGRRTVTGFFQLLSKAAESYDFLQVKGLDPAADYRVRTVDQPLYVGRFGLLTKHILPVELNPDGVLLRTADRLYTLNDCVEEYRAGGDMLAMGILLNNQFMGSWYNKQTRLLGDFGSNLYVTEKIEERKEEKR